MDDEPDWENILFKARVAITDNPGFNEWYGALTPHLRQILDDLLDHNVTPEMINDAQDATEEEWEEHTFIQRTWEVEAQALTIANDLTDIVLGLVPWNLEHGRNRYLIRKTASKILEAVLAGMNKSPANY